MAIFIAIGASFGGGATTKAGSDSPKTKSATKNTKPLQHIEDVTVTSCAADDAGYAAAKVAVKNSSSKASNYIVTVTFESPDGATQIGSGVAAVNNLAPGQTSTEDANSLKTAAGEFTCKVADVTRYAS